MLASINLLNYQGDDLDNFTISYDTVTRISIESYLSGQYGLNDGYEISYVDEDGDEIAVEFDDDYEVAKLTHEQGNLKLNIKITNLEWLQMFKKPKQEEKSQSQQKVQPSLLEPLIQHDLDDLQEETQAPQEPTKLQEEILAKPNNGEDIQNLLSVNHVPTQSKRTETQTSELQSEKQIPQAKPPKKKPILDFIEDRIPFVEEENEIEKIQVLEPKISEKPKEKKKKQKISKPEKKPKGMNEKEIKKLVKKEVFKLLPQIAEKIKFMEEVDDSSESQKLQCISNIKPNKFQNLSQCTVCLESLQIPFYLNSSEGIRMCAKCEEIDCSQIPLVKIRSEAMIEKLSWAQPLAYLTKTSQQVGSIKHLTEIKKEFSETIKKQFDSLVKSIKDEAKRQKKEKAKNQKKEKKEVKDEQLV